MSGKEASGSNAASASSSTAPLGHRKTPKNRNSTRKRTAKKNTKVGKKVESLVPDKLEENVIDQKDAKAANATATDQKIVDMPQQPATNDNKPKDDLEMAKAPEEVVIPETESPKKMEDNEPIEDLKPDNIKVTEDTLPTEDSKGADDKLPDDEQTCVADTEEENITAKDLIDEEPKNVIEPTKVDQDLGKDMEPADNAGKAENTSGKVKKNKRRHRRTPKNRKRALDFGASGFNKPAVQTSGAAEPKVPASGPDEPTILASAANEPTASSSAANEPTASTSEAKAPTTGTNEQPAGASCPSANLSNQYEIGTDDEVDDDYDPDDHNNEEQDWDVQDGVWELYE